MSSILYGKEDQTLTAVVLSDFPPLYQLDYDGKPTGFAIDLLNHIAEKKKLKINYKIVRNWGQAFRAIRRGEGDFMPGTGISPKRQKEFLFTTKIEDLYAVCFVRSENSSIKGCSDFSGVKTGVIKWTIAYNRLRKNKNVKLSPFYRVDAALFALLAGEIDTFIFPEHALFSRAREIGVADRIKIIGAPFLEHKRAYLVSKKRPELIALFNPVIQRFIHTPEYQALYVKWHGQPPPFWSIQNILIIVVLLLGLFGLFLTIWWMISLKKMNIKLKEQESYLNTIKQYSGDPMYLVNSNGDIIDVNLAACESLGYTCEVLLQKKIMDIDVDYISVEKIWGIPKQFLEGIERPLQGTHIRANGETFPVELTISLVIIKGAKCVLAFARDISDRERQANIQRLESIGQLSGGIAHDFNNILNGIIGYTELSLRKLDQPGPIQGYLEKVLQASDRAGTLVKQILTFSRRSDRDVHSFNVLPVVLEVVALLKASFPASIDIQVIAGDGLFVVTGDEAHVHEMIMNLATNSYHAMGEKGQLTIEVFQQRYSKVEGILGTITPGEYIVISVADSGTGINPEVLRLMFDPFYTTKDPGKGTGLGLSVIYGVMKEFAGNIEVESVVDHGTTFRLIFPVNDLETSIIKLNPAKQSLTGTESILFVDDEEIIVAVAEEFLKMAGYRVIATTSSEEALGFFEHNPDQFDLIITDYAMPEITGIELVRRVREFRSDLPVIICSGNRSVLDPVEIDALGVTLIDKPITQEKLVVEIKKLVN